MPAPLSHPRVPYTVTPVRYASGMNLLSDDKATPVRSADIVTGSVPFPIPYQGSKRKLAPAILRCFPPRTQVLYEPFCGSAAITIAALSGGLIQHAKINDSNKALMSLWAKIILSPTQISSGYRELWLEQQGHERDFYNRIRDEFNSSHQPEHLLYLLARCVKAAVRYNSNGQFNQSPDHRRKGSHPDRMADHILRASLLMNGKVEVSSGDYKDALAQATSDDLVYMDPPYQGVSTNRDRRYSGALAFEEFTSALHDLNDRQISYVISYDGRTGDKTHGQVLPKTLLLEHLEIDAGRSTQATLLGRSHHTIESIYLSPALVERTSGVPTISA